MPNMKLTAEALKTLRSCRLELALSFARCGRNLGAGRAARIAKEICAATGDTSDDVFWAHNAETGHGDYVRVNAGSRAYALISKMKS